MSRIKRITNHSSLKCMKCGNRKISTIDSRNSNLFEFSTIRRRKMCMTCNNRWTTYELTADELKRLTCCK